ncbi:diguanylate cyclase [Philodulcilactobacillus myokoensis]|uniref:DNA polymerase III polC-type n=1 Tax=Philodulcilactobacillus myokoensis TaxID=2929573 RepID=A0A9W6B128_9LACO|nr:exonuclease domain-containing protein [Philodulcilactobacillus myokoensis]GLB46841.1 diguanylate cyclase [Philodulcilactobacillus myokoensis]
MNKVFAVVDLETTGTNVNDGAKIIQFSCSFVQNNRVINNFNTYINPKEEIPERITKLTGISRKQTDHAPTFKQIADKIKRLLSNTIFVAHNVNFDFPFLNQELIQNGFSSLKIQAIDTVTLSQILLPTMPSYRLRDVSGYFNIVHKHPHSSDSDAYATAKLLIVLINRAFRLPLMIINQIIKLKPNLPQDTMQVFKWAQSDHQSDQTPNFLFRCHHLILRKINIHHDQNNNQINLKEKQHFNHNAELKRIIGKIHRHYHHGMMVEIPEYFQRLLAISYSMSKIVSNEHKQTLFILSNQNDINQFINQLIPYLNSILSFPIHGSNFKSDEHYINLLKFSNSLSMPNHTKLDPLIKAKILVWLTITKTGDLDELGINNSQYLNDIRSYPDSFLEHQNQVKNPFAKFDFIKLRNRRVKQDQFIIIDQCTFTNRHFKSIFPIKLKKLYLVYDQAQMLPKVFKKANQLTINFPMIPIIIHRIKSNFNRTHYQNLKNVFHHDLHAYQIIIKSDLLLDQIEMKQNLLLNRFNKFIIKRAQLHSMMDDYEVNIQINQRSQLILINNILVSIVKNTNRIKILSHKLNNIFINQHFHSSDDQFLLDQYQMNLRKLFQSITTMKPFIKMNRQVINQNDSLQSVAFKIEINRSLNPSSIKICYHKNLHYSLTIDDLILKFRSVIFSGSSLFLLKHGQIIKNALKVNPKLTIPIRSHDHPPYSKQMRIFVENHPIDNQIDRVSSKMNQVINANPNLTFIHVNDLETIEPIYESLAAQNNRTILAEGISGSKQKILKMIKSFPNAIVIGSMKLFQNLKWHHNKLKSLLVINNDLNQSARNVFNWKQLIVKFMLLAQNKGTVTLIGLNDQNVKLLINSLPSSIITKYEPLNQIQNDIKMFLINNYI